MTIPDNQDHQLQPEHSPDSQPKELPTLENEELTTNLDKQSGSKNIFILSIAALLILIGSTLAYFGFSEKPYQDSKDMIDQGEIVRTSPIFYSPNLQISQLAQSLLVFAGEYPIEAVQIEADLPITPSTGFVVLTSRISPGGTQVVYTEVSSCFTPEHQSCVQDRNYLTEPNGTTCPECVPVFRVIQKDLATNSTITLFEYDWAVHITKKDPDFLITPIQWTADSKKIVAITGLLYQIPMGGSPIEYTLIDAQGVEKIGRNVVFDTSFSYAAIIKASEDFDSQFGSPYKVEGDSLSIKDLASSEESIISQGDVYRLGEFLQSGELQYYALPRDRADFLTNNGMKDITDIEQSEFEEIKVSFR